MSDRSSVPSRILGACAARLGVGDSLENINTWTLDDGALCYVTEAHLRFELHRDSVASPNGTTVIAPIAGPGRWVVATGGSGAQGAQGSQGSQGGTGAQGSAGSGAQGSQGSQGGAGGALTPLHGVLFIDGAYAGGSSTGAVSAPFTTWQTAVTAAENAGLTSCQFVVCPGAYSGDVLVRGAVQYSFGPAIVGSSTGEYPGTRAIDMTGVLSWTMTDGAMLSITGASLEQAILCADDVAAGTGTVNLVLTGCLCEGVTKNQGGAYSHVLNMSMSGHQGVVEIGSGIAGYIDSLLDNTATISGAFSCQNTFLVAQVSGSSRVIIDSSFLQGNHISCGGQSEITNTVFEGSSTLDSLPGGVIYLDPKSHYWFVTSTGNTHTGSGATFVVYA